jgi:hypothetical protein
MHGMKIKTLLHVCEVLELTRARNPVTVTEWLRFFAVFISHYRKYRIEPKTENHRFFIMCIHRDTNKDNKYLAVIR